MVVNSELSMHSKEGVSMKQIKAVVVGFGDRGSIYASYALLHPEELKIVGVVDISQKRLALAKQQHNLSDAQLFTDLDKCLKESLECDLYINGTMDQLHYEVLKKLIKTKKAVLTEKPIVGKKEELLELEELAKENNTPVYVGHVLRYTPFYKTIKQLILAGEIGEIRSMEMAEHVGSAHYAGSYIRGKWNNEEACGSTLLLAKSCHDLDIMCWLNNITAPHYVSSFGSQRYFKEKDAPKEATEFCEDCPLQNECYFSSKNMYVKVDFSNELTHIDRSTQSEKEINAFLRTNNFGRCVYKIKEFNVVDRQVVDVEFNNGSVCSFALVGGVQEACRTISVIGTTGEITGKLEQGIIYLKKDKLNTTNPDIKVIDVNEFIHKNGLMTNHSGGDYEIMKTLVSHLNGNRDAITITKLSDSINGHLVAYAADEAREQHKVVELKR